IKGEKIERSLKTQSQLYEALNKSNARSWLYSLMELVKFMGFRGAVILLDQFEAILPHTASEVNYTTAKRNDVYELLRQLIDDLDFFRNILIVIAGNSDIVENEFQGLQSYQALWLRIQPGFIQHNHLNLYADMIDADTMFKNLCDSGELKEISDKLQQLGLKELVARQNPMLDEAYIRNFRDLIADKAWI
ncbi:MAG: DUF2791 family P-loop domain-containing protein, partial [Candidatus Cloacimonetes bacterium]|nr:DUF2791 family P-loop domain-containing protein [Candidatus Cloacimonadota bacterium]